MDNGSYNPSDKESSERRNSNSEWLPTKCRITKPPPPKPATNPLQFVKVAPSALFQKAHEQIKKVEEIKTQKHAVKEEAEEWQQNLDNWKSSRRKRQEHIIERVVEVKKLEQEGHDKSRRKSKTFNEMLEDRNKRGHRLNIPIYDDDSNDLSDFGIGSSGSRTNSIKDVDTDDSSSCLDEKEHGIGISDSPSGKDTSSASNQSQSEDELLSVSNYNVDNINKSKPSIFHETNAATVYSNSASTENCAKPIYELTVKHEQYKDEDLTYQRAIEDYRSKILPKINDVDTVFTVKFDKNTTKSVPKVEMFTNKPLCDTNKPIEITHLDLNVSKRLPEDFTNPLSIKERLKNLEKCAGLQVKSVEKHSHGNSVKSIIESFTKQCDNDKKNNSFDSSNTSSSDFPNLVKIGNITKNVSLFLVESPSNTSDSISEVVPRSVSPETMTYINNLNLFNQNLDSSMPKSHSAHSSLSEYSEHITAPLFVSSSELTGVSSDRADSGIHTADVSCSVSQADESVEFIDMLASTIPNCIEKLKKERERELTQQVESKLHSKLVERKESFITEAEATHDLEDYTTNYEDLKQSTQAFLDNVRQDLSNEYAHRDLIVVSTDKISNINDNFSPQQEPQLDKINKITDNCFQQQGQEFLTSLKVHSAVHKFKEKPHENVDAKCYDFLDTFAASEYPLAPPKTKEPPKEKPPPPPEEDKKAQQIDSKRMNSTKRIKWELHIKRSSFLGLDEPIEDLIDPIIPPDINTFLQKESELEKSLYQTHQDGREACSSEVESQDSGLESERGRLSSDTWCSSLGECNILAHGRQDSTQTNNSITSEEDEIIKKEKEIIALIEKEEKSKSSSYKATGLAYGNMVHNNSKDGKFKTPYIPKINLDYNILRTGENSEVLKVEHELLQLEKEELKRQKENVLLKGNKERILHKNRYSLENVGGSPDLFFDYYGDENCRQSMPELPNTTVHANQILNRHTPHYHKSVPNIQQACFKSINIDMQLPSEHRKSMPDLQKTTISAPPYTPHNRHLIMPSKPMASLIKEQRNRDKILIRNQLFAADTVHYQNIKPMIPITRPGLNVLSAVPKQRKIPNENWIQTKTNSEDKSKNYSKHWLFQEAELRRSVEQEANDSKWNYQETKPVENMSALVTQKFSQGYQNQPIIEHNQQFKRSETNISQQTIQHQPYFNRPYMIGHASSNSYSQLSSTENSKGKVLSISGKKKCSFCGNELGRGAAMIIESLCLFYHMDCFKCCVCHIQLGTALVGTDVRVRNNKIHCNNCYTTEDGVKFSCV